MRNMKWIVPTLILVSVGIGLSTPTLAADNARSVDSRLSQLEARFDNRESLALIQRIDELQAALQQMQGQLEVTQHQLELIETQQRELYGDMDRRLTDLGLSDTMVNDQNTQNPPTLTLGAGIDDMNNMSEMENILNSQDNEPINAVNMTSLPASPIAMDDDQAEYAAAYQLLVDRHYDQSAAAFDEYLGEFPQGAYVPNALYWLGEVYLLQGSYEQADQAFQQVVNDYAAHPKAGDALLKLGYTYDAQGDVNNARTVLMQVTSQYPGTAIAQLAEVKLLDLRQGAMQ